MSKKTKFIGFLESVKHTNPALIESIKKGFNLCFEGVFDGDVTRRTDGSIVNDNDPDYESENNSALEEMNDRKLSKSSDPEFYKESIINKVSGGDFSKVNEVLSLPRHIQAKYFDTAVLETIKDQINDMANISYEPEIARAVNGLVRQGWLRKETVFAIIPQGRERI